MPSIVKIHSDLKDVKIGKLCLRIDEKLCYQFLGNLQNTGKYKRGKVGGHFSLF